MKNILRFLSLLSVRISTLIITIIFFIISFAFGRAYGTADIKPDIVISYICDGLAIVSVVLCLIGFIYQIIIVYRQYKNRKNGANR